MTPEQEDLLKNSLEEYGNPLLQNGQRTPDGTEIYSRHRHDYRKHDDANGETYMVDGGTDYQRRNLNFEFAKDLSQVYEPDNHEHNRQWAHWGTFGKDGEGSLRWVAVKDMDTDHLEAVLESPNVGLRLVVRSIMEEELTTRRAVLRGDETNQSG